MKDSKAHFFVDDTQLLVSFPPVFVHTALERINFNIEEFMKKVSPEWLKINGNKSKALLFCFKLYRIVIQDQIKVEVSQQIVEPTTNAENLGLVVDDELHCHEHLKENKQPKNNFQK